MHSYSTCTALFDEAILFKFRNLKIVSQVPDFKDYVCYKGSVARSVHDPANNDEVNDK